VRLDHKDESHLECVCRVLERWDGVWKNRGALYHGTKQDARKVEAHKCIEWVRGVRVVLDILLLPGAVLEQLCKRVKNSG
jgi:hypothetical protein